MAATSKAKPKSKTNPRAKGQAITLERRKPAAKAKAAPAPARPEVDLLVTEEPAQPLAVGKASVNELHEQAQNTIDRLEALIAGYQEDKARVNELGRLLEERLASLPSPEGTAPSNLEPIRRSSAELGARVIHYHPEGGNARVPHRMLKLIADGQLFEVHEGFGLTVDALIWAETYHGGNHTHDVAIFEEDRIRAVIHYAGEDDYRVTSFDGDRPSSGPVKRCGETRELPE